MILTGENWELWGKPILCPSHLRGPAWFEPKPLCWKTDN